MTQSNKIIKIEIVQESLAKYYDNELAEILKEIWDNKDSLNKKDLINLGFFSKKSYLNEYKLIEK